MSYEFKPGSSKLVSICDALLIISKELELVEDAKFLK